jgi:hypothetical protein
MKKERHIKGKRKETWTESRIEIQSIVESLGITKDRFAEVDIHSWEDIRDKILKVRKAFTKAPNYAVPCSEYPFQFLDKLVDKNENVWFLINETINEKTKFWIYEGFIQEAQKIFEETYRVNEIIVVSKKFEWILMIDDHDIISGTGEMIEKLRVLNKRINLH